jgi:hypothetical protein
MNASQRSFLALFLAVAACGASGQQVWRCGNSYGTKPCAGGTAVDVTDHQSPADAAQARKLVAEEAKRADAMEKTRLANEKNAPKAIVIGVREAPKEAEPAHDKKHPKKKKGDKHEPEGFTASTGPKKK